MGLFAFTPFLYSALETRSRLFHTQVINDTCAQALGLSLWFRKGFDYRD